MQVFPCSGFAPYKTAMSTLIIRIILDHKRFKQDLFNLGREYAPFINTLEGMELNLVFPI